MDKKEELINIATKLFSENGFENTPISVICETANVSKGLISHHFKSKNGLLKEIFKKTTRAIMEMNVEGKPNLSPKQQLKQLLESFFIQLEADKFFFQFNLNVMVQPTTREVLKELIEERSSFIFQATLKIFTQIDKEDANVLSYIFIAELDGIALNYLGIFNEYPLEQIKNRIIKKYTVDELH